MNVIIDNPFRILGLLVNSTEKELQRQLSRLKAYANVGKSVALEYDFEYLGEVERTTENIFDAASRIEQARDKLHYGLFWFVHQNQYDEIAINHLKENNISKATEIWEKVTKGKQPDQTNFSNAFNLSSLQLSKNISNGKFNLGEFTEALRIKCEIINSEFFSFYSNLVTGNSGSVDSEKILNGFLDEILALVRPRLDSPGGPSTSQLMQSFQLLPTKLQKYAVAKFTDKPITLIENQIEESKSLRNDSPEDAGECGEALIKSTNEALQFLNSTLSSDNLQLQMIANKLASEILQCSIDYFNSMRDDDEVDPGDTSLHLARYAYSISYPGQVKDRIEENLESIEEWVEEKPERLKRKSISQEIDYITEQLMRSEMIPDSFENATRLLKNCEPKLHIIRDCLGVFDEFYLNISSTVAQAAQNMIVELVNTAGQKTSISSPFGFNNRTKIESVVQKALEVSFIIRKFALNPHMSASFAKNFGTLKSIATQFGLSTLSPEEKREAEARAAEERRRKGILETQKKMEWELQNAKNYLEKIPATVFFAAEYATAIEEMNEIKKWKLFRTKATKEQQISQQEAVIKNILNKGELEKQKELVKQATLIQRLEEKLKDFIKANMDVLT